MTYLGTSLWPVLSPYNYGRAKLITQYLKFINTLQKKYDRDIFGGSTLICRPCGTSQSCCRIWTDKLYIHIIAGDPFTVFFSAWKYAKLLAGQVLRKGPAERRAPCSSIGGAQTLLQFCQCPLPHLFALPLILSSAGSEVLRGNIPAVFAPLCTSSSPDLSWNFSGLNTDQSPPKRSLFRLLTTIA